MLFTYKDQKIEIPFEFKTEPYKHQETTFLDTALEFNWAYFLEMGCGKSKILLDKIALLAQIKKINAAVILAPKGVFSNWTNKEIPQHFSDKIPYTVFQWGGTTKADKKALELLLDPTTSSNTFTFFIMNIEAIAKKNGRGITALNKFLDKYAPNCLIGCDESTVIKNIKAKRTEAAIAAARRCYYRVILTGSPITKSPLDLYAQTSFLKKGILGHNSFYTFRNEYAVMIDKTNPYTGDTFKHVIGYKNEDKLKTYLQNFSTRLTKQDCLDLPEKIYTQRDIELTEEQERIYKTLKKENLVFLNSYDQISTQQAVTKLLRLHQVVCGCTKTDSGELISIPNNRLSGLMEQLEEISGKVIIWANYRPNIKDIYSTIRENYGDKSVVHYFGDTTDDERDLAKKRFQEDDSCRFFVGNTQTGGYGITLTASSDTIYYSNNYDLEKRLQSEDRNHRIGQKNAVTYVDLVSPNTVDMKILQALRSKIDISTAILGDGIKDWLL